MKRIAGVTCLILSCLFGAQAMAGSCKPDVSREDSITKQKIDIWTQELFATSFMGSLWSTSEVGIVVTVGRYGLLNAINLEIRKSEESATNAAFEAAYRGAQGKPFYFGFKSGEPVTLVVTQVNNSANVQQGLFAAKGVTTVVLSALLSDAQLGALRDALTTKPVDALRIVLAGDMTIDKPVGDKNGRRLMEKFGCFFQTLDERGVSLTAAGSAEPPPASLRGGKGAPSAEGSRLVEGRYERRGKPSDFIEIGHGEFTILQDGHHAQGTYTVQGDIITVSSRQVRGEVKAQIIGDTIKDNEGIIWERQIEQKKPAASLSIDQVMQMVTAKLADDIIILTIQNSRSTFDLTPETMIKLKTAGASDAVIRAMAGQK